MLLQFVSAKKKYKRLGWYVAGPTGTCRVQLVMALVALLVLLVLVALQVLALIRLTQINEGFMLMRNGCTGLSQN